MLITRQHSRRITVDGQVVGYARRPGQFPHVIVPQPDVKQVSPTFRLTKIRYGQDIITLARSEEGGETQMWTWAAHTPDARQRETCLLPIWDGTRESALALTDPAA